jgi:hypothetical protein
VWKEEEGTELDYSGRSDVQFTVPSFIAKTSFIIEEVMSGIDTGTRKITNEEQKRMYRTFSWCCSEGLVERTNS